MYDAVKECMKHLQQEIERAEFQAHYWETSGVLNIDEKSGRDRSEELAAIYRKFAQELLEQMKSLSS